MAPRQRVPAGLIVRRPILSQRASFWVAAAVVAHTLWTSAAPAMTYPLYATEWGLGTTETTTIFAIYPIVVVVVLIGFGDVSDSIGRRATMLLGLGASITGVLLFALATDVAWIFVGRSFMGIGVGLSAGPSTAAMVEFAGDGQSQRAGSIATIAQAAGLALAFLVGGMLIEYAPLPTHLDFWVLFVVLALVFAAVWFLPSHTRGETKGRWKPKAVKVPEHLRGAFTTSSASVACAYSLGAVMLSLGAQIAHDLIGSSNALVSGAVLSSFAWVSGGVALLGKHLPHAVATAIGGGATIAAMTLLIGSASYRSFPVFLASTCAAGVGYSLMFLGGLNLINAKAPSHHRGATLSALYLIAYLIQGIVALLLGVAAKSFGLRPAIDLAAAGIAMLAAAAIVLALSAPGHGRDQSSPAGGAERP